MSYLANIVPTYFYVLTSQSLLGSERVEIRPSGVADRPSVCAVVAVGARLNGRTIAGGEEARDVMGLG